MKVSKFKSIVTLTCNQITPKPLKIVTAYPMSEWEQWPAILEEVMTIRDSFSYPLGSRRLLFDERFCGLYRKDGFSSCYTIRWLIPVIQFDAQHFGQSVTGLVLCPRHSLYVGYFDSEEGFLFGVSRKPKMLRAGRIRAIYHSLCWLANRWITSCSELGFVVVDPQIDPRGYAGCII